MDPITLIKKSSKRACADVSHVMREVFHDILSEDTYSEQTLKHHNAFQTRNKDMQQYKNLAGETFDSCKLHLDDISDVEKSIMHRQGDFLIRSAKLDKNMHAKDKLKLYKQPAFQDLPNRMCEKYALLQSDYVLPTKIERAIDFTMSDNERKHLKDHLTQSYNSLNSFFDTCKYKPHQRDSDANLKSVSEKHLPPIISRSNCCKTKRKPLVIPTVTELPIHLRVKLENPPKSHKPPPLKTKLVTEPKEAIFYEYSLNVTYELVVTLRNVSLSVAHFALPVDNFEKCVILWTSTTKTLAPGMSTTFTLRFRTDTYEDMNETLYINVLDAEDVVFNIKSLRKQPILTGFVIRSDEDIMNTTISFKPEPNLILNSTIDCKVNFIGATVKYSLYLQNGGSASSFFIISEKDWYIMDINDLNKNNELILPSFKIYPVYFYLNENDIMEITIEFCPIEFGFYIDKILIMCDNCTYDHLDLVGDSTFYSSNFVVLEIPEKMFSISLEADFFSKYFIILDAILLNESSSAKFKICNKSLVKLPFYWKLRRPKIYTSPNTKLLCMNPEWITVTPMKGVLLPESEKKFSLTVNQQTLKAGIYSYVLEFFVANIPECCLEDNSDFIAEESENYDDTKLVDILVGSVEIWQESVAISIFIEPCMIDIQGEVLHINETVIREINVLNMINFDLNCKWVESKKAKFEISKNKVTITPTSFMLPALSMVSCNCTISALEQSFIETLFVCDVNNGSAQMELLVKADVANPKLSISKQLLNFGYVKCETEHKQEFTLTNESQTCLHWSIEEYVFNSEMNKLTRAGHSYCNHESGWLCQKNGKVLLEYSLFTQKPERWCSILVINKNVHEYLRESDFVLVYGNIIIPVSGIYTSKVLTATLRPGKMFLQTQGNFEITLRNYSPVTISFCWGYPEGNQESDLYVTVYPSKGEIRPHKSQSLIISIFPVHIGHICSYYIPCFIGRAKQPIYLHIDLKVQDIKVEFELAETLASVLWPEVDPINTLSITYSECSSVSLFQKLTDFSSKETTSTSKPLSFEEPNQSSADISVSSISNSIGEEVGEEEICLPDSFYPSGMTWTTFSSRSSHSQLRKQEPKKSSIESILQSRLVEQTLYSNNFKLQLEYFKVPLRTAVKKTIIIRNRTPVESEYMTKIKNYYESDEQKEPTRLDRINDILKNKTRDEWAYRVAPGLGLVIKIENPNGKIPPLDYCALDVWIYANTWGVYFDEISVAIPRLPPFLISVIVEVVGYPIEFVATLSSSPLTLRFGSFQSDVPPITRIVKVRNTSAVPILIVWHIFLNPPKKDELAKNPFSLVIDIYQELISPNESSVSLDDEDNSIFDLSIQPYYGEEDFLTFEVQPSQVLCSPNSITSINLTLYVDSIRKISHYDISALLVGFLKMSHYDRVSADWYRRLNGYNLKPLLVNISATIIAPEVKIEFPNGNLSFKVWAASIISNTGGNQIRQSFIIRNKYPIPIILRLSVPLPFEIVHIKTPIVSKKIGSKTSNVEIPALSSCEVTIECNVIKDYMVNINDTLLKETYYEFLNKAIVIEKFITIQQANVGVQQIPVEIYICYPDIDISTDTLEFGPVFIRATKVLCLSLINRTTEPVSVDIRKRNFIPEFEIVPTSGVLAPCKGVQSHPMDFYVNFTPNDSRMYNEQLIISIPSEAQWQIVQLSGVGTKNAKFFCGV